MCVQYLEKRDASRNQLQKLLGHLLYIHKCIPPARLFTNRILNTLRNAPRVGKVILQADFFKDIKWFTTFLETFNGSVKIHGDHQPAKVLCVDASLVALGAKFENKVYSLVIPNILSQICTIVHFKAVNIIVALRTWSTALHNDKCIIYCDNMAVVECFTSHKIRNPFLMACVRTAWLICAQNNIKLVVKFIAGYKNIYADILSRWQSYNACKNIEVEFLKKCQWYSPDPLHAIPDFKI